METKEGTIKVQMSGREFELDCTIYNDTIALIPHLAVEGNCLIGHIASSSIFAESLGRGKRGISREKAERIIDVLLNAKTDKGDTVAEHLHKAEMPERINIEIFYIFENA